MAWALKVALLGSDQLYTVLMPCPKAHSCPVTKSQRVPGVGIRCHVHLGVTLWPAPLVLVILNPTFTPQEPCFPSLQSGQPKVMLPRWGRWLGDLS